MTQPELGVRLRWSRTGDAYFPLAARSEAGWCVLRVNGFPDHPVWTLFVDGQVRCDVEDAPAAWVLPTDGAVPLSAADAEEALAPLRDLVAYGSEVGQPCDNPYCCG